jgi:tRNA delta(2)-isopentenylpyrophosphate transferase
VGGSGLYSDAVINGLDEFPDVNSSVREQLNKDLNEKGIQYLQSELKETDPDYYSEVDINNPHRIIRALEIVRSSGLTYSTFRKKSSGKEKVNRKFNTLYIGLNAQREIIYDRINKRVDQMIEHGLIEEAKILHPHKNLNALQTVGYKELFKYFDGEYKLDHAIDEIKKNTRRFAKRQETWFKKNEAIHWFKYNSHPSEIIDFIKSYIQ